jgi:[ribosomal protein S18]-alanine N-acetyltransferase
LNRPRLIIRLATSKDAEPIAIESMAEIEHNLNWGWTPDRVHRAIFDPETNVVVTSDEKGMVAFGIMMYEDDIAHLQLFAVREDARRRGIGSALLLWLERVARVAGVTHFKVEARRDNTAALGFYLKHGYLEREAVSGMYQGFVDGVRLEKIAAFAAKEA